MATRKPTAWSDDEVQTFLCLVADDRIQREPDGAARRLNVFHCCAVFVSHANDITGVSGLPCYDDPTPVEVILNCNGKRLKPSRVESRRGE